MEITGPADADITGLTADSRNVQPGFLFAAFDGEEADGDDSKVELVSADVTPPGELADMPFGGGHEMVLLNAASRSRILCATCRMPRRKAR